MHALLELPLHLLFHWEGYFDLLKSKRMLCSCIILSQKNVLFALLLHICLPLIDIKINQC